MSALAWGRRYLLCPPDHYEVAYEINPWMHRDVSVDADAARRQWDGLVTALTEAGAAVELIEPVAGLPDMVFTANGAAVDGWRCVQSRFLHPERGPEAEHFGRWFADHGYEIRHLPPTAHLEGAGDVLPFGRRLLGGYRSRSDFAGQTALAQLLDLEVLPVELVDPRFYHLDLSFCPLDDRRALVVPEAWDRYGRQVVEALVPEPIVLEPDEAASFCANAVVVGSTVLLPASTSRLDGVLRGLGFDIGVVPVGEFLKAGGGVRCLTLALDVSLAETAS